MEARETGLFDLLRHRLAEEAMPGDAPLAVAELHRRLVPYSLCRQALDLATKAEYDVALLRLLADEGRTRVEEPALRDAVRRELDSPEPGLGLLHRFAASEVRLVPGAAAGSAAAGRAAPEAPAPPGPPTPPSPPAPRAARAGRAGPPPAAHETERRDTDRVPGLDDLEVRPTGAAGGACRSCRASLPDVDGLRFCPSCGTDQARWPCAGCGAEVEAGWRYCPRCGIVQVAI